MTARLRTYFCDQCNQTVPRAALRCPWCFRPVHQLGTVPSIFRNLPMQTDQPADESRAANAQSGSQTP